MASPPSISRRRFAALAAAALGMPRPARAQAYPNRPVRLILPFAAGGVTDVIWRLAAERLGDKLGQRFVVENMAGPAGIPATRAVLSAAPDGYTLGLITSGTAISVAMYKSLPFDPVADFAPVSLVGDFELVLVTSTDSPYRSVGEFIAAARAAPGKLNIGTVAVGSSQHLGAVLFRSAAKVDVQIVPYKTTPEVVTGLLRNDIQMTCEIYAGVRAQIGENKLRPIATSGPTRTFYLPALPTVAEAGVPGFDVQSWNGLGAPAKTPPAVVATLNKALHEILTDPDMVKRYAGFGIRAQPTTPEELRARLIADIRKWSEVIDNAGIPRL
ncbi:MAG: tripartite tricarboxylate transporter substrate binding protein [Hyphomicrobiales bacterium]|nr:tripartite tricarboxylate transporter substrate binding protein [Hyphomicrobiales bacterium]